MGRRKIYDENSLVLKLHDLTDVLGRPPTYDEVDRGDFSPTSGPYRRVFGKWSDALEFAGLNQLGYSRNELVGILKITAKALGKTPTADYVESLEGVPNKHIFAKEFGSWNGALEAAGLKKNKRTLDISDFVSETIYEKRCSEGLSVEELSVLFDLPREVIMELVTTQNLLHSQQ